MAKTLSKAAPCLEEFVKIRGTILRDTSQLDIVVAHVSELKVLADRARENFCSSLQESDFDAWSESRQRAVEADQTFQEIARSYSELSRRSASSDGTAEVIASCLREMRGALEGQVLEFRREVAALSDRLLGQTTPAEPPICGDIQQEIARLDDGISRIENSDDPGPLGWADHSARITAWIQANAPALLE